MEKPPWLSKQTTSTEAQVSSTEMPGTKLDWQLVSCKRMIWHTEASSKDHKSLEFTHFMQSANKADSTVIEEKFIMFSHFLPNKENANMHFLYLTHSLQKYQRTKRKWSSFILSTNPTQKGKKNPTKLTTNIGDKGKLTAELLFIKREQLHPEAMAD